MGLGVMTGALSFLLITRGFGFERASRLEQSCLISTSSSEEHPWLEVIENGVLESFMAVKIPYYEFGCTVQLLVKKPG